MARAAAPFPGDREEVRVKLYYSTCTSSTPVHIALEEAGARYERVEVSWQRDLNVAELDRVTPFGRVPALVLDDGAVLTQSVAILEHVADTHPGARLLAAPGTAERAHIVAWCAFAASDLLRTFGPIVRHEEMTSSEAAHDDLVKFAHAEAHKQLELVERSLAGRTYLVGERFTIADAAVFFATSLAGWLEVDTTRYEGIRAHQARVAARPATRRILELEDLL